MSRVKRSIPDDWLRDNRVNSLPPETLLVAEQAAELLGCTADSLLDRRRDGKPPPFRQEKVRGRVKYPLGGVLAERRANVFSSADQARAAHHAEVLGYPAPTAIGGGSTFASFIESALPNDEWLFTFVDGKPSDFFASLSIEQSDDAEIVCRWLTFTEYLNERSRWAIHREWELSRDQSDLSHKDLERTTPPPAALDMADSVGLCDRGCGRASHPGRNCRL